MRTVPRIRPCVDLRKLRYGIAYFYPRNTVWGNLWTKPARECGGGRNLIVFVPGFRSAPAAYANLLDSLKDECVEPFKNADFLMITYRSHLTSNADPTEIARKLSDMIQSAIDGNRYSQVYLLGHSLGGLLLRRAVVEGRNSAAQGRLIPPETNWTYKIARVILLASGNRGFYLNKIS